MDTDQIAQLAMSLRDNEVFQMALDNQRNGAIEALVKVDATDTNAIHSYQATVRVVDELRDDIEGFIRSGKPKPQSGIA